ncbi:MAG: transcription termination factor Rho [Sedimentisphaerales bacterium]|nr:transcription termination factor Rho [Sedimentisphaerales bacterium]
MPDLVSGVVKKTPKGNFVLRDPARSFRTAGRDVIVPASLMQRCGLCEGAAVVGPARVDKGIAILENVESVCGLTVEQFKNRTPYQELTAVSPHQRFDLEKCGDLSMRIVDLIAPMGKGTRGLIVSPPKAGKTMMLAQLAKGILADDPKTHIIILLIDERPEEVTHFKRSIEGVTVVASSIDQTIEEHIALAEILLACIRIELECGRDVVVLVDSITRMGRAFNRKGTGTGRIMSGGLEAGVLEIPRRFLGMARKIENGGSVTIIATALIDTGSRMDQLIFEEFKGTGNSEIMLSRSLAEQRIFPAIDIPASGTRMDEALWGSENSRKFANLRKALANHKPAEAITTLMNVLKKCPTNAELLKILPA